MIKNKKFLFLSLLFSSLCFVLFSLLVGGQNVIGVMAGTKTMEPVEMVVLMYHSVNSKESRSNDYVITPNAFEADLKYIKDNGYTTVTMVDIISFVEDCVPLPEKPIMITFDDGYYNNYLHVFPLLEKYESRVVLSIIGIESDKYSELLEYHENYSHATWPQIKEMHASGLVEFQNHSYDMHKLDTPRRGASINEGETVACYQESLKEDMTALQECYKEHLDYVPTTYTYPFGRISEASYDVMEDMGFKASFDVQGRIYKCIPGDSSSLYRIPRFNRSCNTTAQEILESGSGTPDSV